MKVKNLFFSSCKFQGNFKNMIHSISKLNFSTPHYQNSLFSNYSNDLNKSLNLDYAQSNLITEFNRNSNRIFNSLSNQQSVEIPEAEFNKKTNQAKRKRIKRKTGRQIRVRTK